MRQVIKIGGKIVRHGRYVTFQMAEVVIPRDLFADILRRINRLRPRALNAVSGGLWWALTSVVQSVSIEPTAEIFPFSDWRTITSSPEAG